MKKLRKLLLLTCSTVMVFSLSLLASCGEKKGLGDFNLTALEDGATNVVVLPQFTWGESKGAESYELKISKNADLSDAQTFTIEGNTFTLTEKLDYSTKYYWSVTAIKADEKHESKNVFSFTTAAFPLGDFSITAPSNAQEEVALKPTFTWEASGENAKYNLSISKKSDMSDPVVYSDIMETTYTVENELARNTNYYALVTANVNEVKKDSSVISFKTVDSILFDFNDLSEEVFAKIFTAKAGEYSQNLDVSLATESWEGCENGKSLKLSGSNLLDWGYLQMMSEFSSLDISGYDGISFKIYPKVADERLGMILHLVNKAYPNDCLGTFYIKGNAPSVVKIPFSALTLRPDNSIGSFDSENVTGLWFTFKSAASCGGEGFSGKYSNFEVYIDDIAGYKTESSEIEYTGNYTNEFSFKSIEIKDDNATITYSKSGAGESYTAVVSMNDDLSEPLATIDVTDTFSIVDGVPVASKTLPIGELPAGVTYYVAIKCGDVVSEIKTFDKIKVLKQTIDFENISDTAGISSLCTITNGASITFSDTNGANDSNALHYKATQDAETILAGLWTMQDFDFLSFYYNVPTGKANFYLRLYLGSATAGGKRAYLDFSSTAKQLKGEGYIVLPMNAAVFAMGGGATAADFSANNIKAFGIFLKSGSAEFYIDNVSVFNKSELPTINEYIEASALRKDIEKLDNGTYTVSLMTGINPILGKSFTVTDGVCSLSKAEFEDLLVAGTVCDFVVANASGDFKLAGKINIKSSVTIDFNDLADTEALKAACKNGIQDPKAKVSLSENGGVNNSKAVFFDKPAADNDTILKGLWEYKNFDYIQFYYNIPTGKANFFLRIYVNNYSYRGYVDFSTAAYQLSGSGYIRVPISSEYLTLGGNATADMISSENITGFGLFIKAGSAAFYIDDITLLKAEALTKNTDLTAVAQLRAGLSQITSGENYRLVVEKSNIGSKVLFPVVNKVFNLSTDIATTELEDVLTAGKYIYTVYTATGEIIGSGKLTIA